MVKYFKQNIDDDEYTEDVSAREILHGTGTANAEEKTFEGFTFDDSLISDPRDKAIEPNGSTVINLYYTRNPHSVTYDDGVANEDLDVPDAETGIRYGKKVNVNFTNQPERTGHTFTGWNDGTTTYTNVSGGVTSFDMPDSDVTLTAQWDTITYTLTFNLNGGTIDSSNASIVRTGEYGSALTAVSNLSKTGYDFAGWKWTDEDGTDHTEDTAPSTVPAANRVYTAQWNIKSYSLTYNGNGSTGGTVPVVSAPIEYSATVNVNFPGDLTRTGYNFAGWSTSADGTGASYTSGGTTSFTMPASNVTLYAQWTPVTYTITYELNGGMTVVSNPGSYTIETPDFTLNEPMRNDYDFDGWYTDVTDESTKVLSITQGSTGNKTLYAKWTARSFNIYYEENGGTWTAGYTTGPSSYTVDDVQTLPTSDEIVKTDYLFAGWYDNESLSGDAVTTTAGASGSKTYYAKWRPLYATVGGTQYFTKEATVTAITEATGDISVVLYSPVTASDLGSAQSEGKICYAIKNSQADTISLSVANGHSISLESCMNMFNECTKLVSADLRGFNTSNVTNMGYMFAACTSLSTLDISTFDFSKVSYIVAMFRGCTALTSLDGVNFACKPSSTAEMFKGCSALSALDISALDTSNVTSMGAMFEECSSLTELDVSGFDTKKVTNMQSMFRGCKKLTSLNLSNFNTAAVTQMNHMFYQCEKLTDLDLSSFDTSKVTNMTYMFCSCKEVTSITVSSNFVTDAVTSSSDMFMNCSKLVGGAGTPYDSQKRDATYARIDGGTSNPGYFTGATNYAKVGSTYYPDKESTIAAISDSSLAGKTITVTLFGDLTQTDIGSSSSDNTIANAIKDTTANAVKLVIDANAQITIGNASGMFKNCTKLIYADLRGFNTQTTENMYQMFYGCTSLTELDLSSFNTASVSSMDSCFENCGALRTIYASNSFEAPSSTNVFKGCTSLVGGAGTPFNSSITGNLYARIDDPHNNEAGYFTAKP